MTDDVLQPNTHQGSVEWDALPDGELSFTYKEVRRGDRNDALEKAAQAYKKRNPRDDDGGLLPSVFERVLADNLITEWDLDTPPAMAWNDLPISVGDNIAETIGVQDALESLQVGDSEEAAKAKNS